MCIERLIALTIFRSITECISNFVRYILKKKEMKKCIISTTAIKLKWTVNIFWRLFITRTPILTQKIMKREVSPEDCKWIQDLRSAGHSISGRWLLRGSVVVSGGKWFYFLNPISLPDHVLPAITLFSMKNPETFCNRKDEERCVCLHVILGDWKTARNLCFGNLWGRHKYGRNDLGLI